MLLLKSGGEGEKKEEKREAEGLRDAAFIENWKGSSVEKKSKLPFSEKVDSAVPTIRIDLFSLLAVTYRNILRGVYHSAAYVDRH